MNWFDNKVALHAWADTARPVFICGQERSGTSALFLALSQHPALFAVPHVYETFVFVEPRGLLADPAPTMLRDYLHGADNLQQLRRRLSAMAAMPGEASGDPSTLDDQDLIRAFFAYSAFHVYGGKRPVEKTPVHVYCLKRVFEIFPRARVLACVRDPIEVVDSYRRRLQREQLLGKSRDAWGWLEKDDQSLIHQFRRVDRALSEAAEFAPGKVFQVPYAWLNGDSQAAMSAICQFLGEPFDPAVMGAKAAWRDRVDERLGQPIGTAAPARTLALTPESEALLRKETFGLTRRWQVAGPLKSGRADT